MLKEIKNKQTNNQNNGNTKTNSEVYLQFHFDKHDETSETERQGLV
jgi:hypothetical protein